MAPTPLRHPSLSSKAARDRLSHRPEAPFTGVASAIDNLAAIHDGLAAVRYSEDPTLTAEARAHAYRQAFDKAKSRAEQLVAAAVERLLAYEERVRADALKVAGLDAPPPPHEAAEIRSALRSLTPNERDRAVAQAADNGDRAVLAAVLHSPSSLLVGPLTTPVETMAKLFIDKAVPSLKTDLADVEAALGHLNLAAGGFKQGAEAMRDRLAEDRAATGRAKAQAATAALEQALGSAAPPAA